MWIDFAEPDGSAVPLYPRPGAPTPTALGVVERVAIAAAARLMTLAGAAFWVALAAAFIRAWWAR